MEQAEYLGCAVSFVECPYCGNVNKVLDLRNYRRCYQCKKTFEVPTGTLFNLVVERGDFADRRRTVCPLCASPIHCRGTQRYKDRKGRNVKANYGKCKTCKIEIRILNVVE